MVYPFSQTGQSHPKPSISVSPSEMINLGENATIQCDSELYPEAEFHLLKQTVVSPHTWAIQTARQHRAVFQISSAKASDGAVYWCIYCVKALCDEQSPPSDRITLNVIGEDLVQSWGTFKINVTKVVLHFPHGVGLNRGMGCSVGSSWHCRYFIPLPGLDSPTWVHSDLCHQNYCVDPSRPIGTLEVYFCVREQIFPYSVRTPAPQDAAHAPAACLYQLLWLGGG